MGAAPLSNDAARAILTHTRPSEFAALARVASAHAARTAPHAQLFHLLLRTAAIFSLAAPPARSASEGRVKFYREVELKHGRVAMLAALGFVVGEHFHPLWGGNVDVPSYIAFQETPLQAFWPAVVIAIAVPEIFSVFTFQSPFGGETWSMRTDHEAGDLGFDPAGLKPAGGRDLLAMQNAELNNGRLAMIAAAGMIVQETFVTHAKLF